MSNYEVDIQGNKQYIRSPQEKRRNIMNRSIIQVCSFLLSLTVMWKYEDIHVQTGIDMF